MPKVVIRADFKDFYESIPRAKLLRKIDEDQLLAPTSKRYIRQVLLEYSLLPGSEAGIPRGVGFSAYLAELFARSFDRDVRKHAGIIYYARYVDDIVVLLSHHPGTPSSIDFVTSAAERLGLSLNKDKTFIEILDKAKELSFEYLGYAIKVQNGSVRLKLSSKKLKKYQNRIVASFSAYEKNSKLNEKKARELLVRRIRYLTR